VNLHELVPVALPGETFGQLLVDGCGIKDLHGGHFRLRLLATLRPIEEGSSIADERSARERCRRCSHQIEEVVAVEAAAGFD
jgi:hypothetical protein